MLILLNNCFKSIVSKEFPKLIVSQQLDGESSSAQCCVQFCPVLCPALSSSVSSSGLLWTQFSVQEYAA